MKMFARMKDDLAGFAKDERGEDWTLEDPGKVNWVACGFKGADPAGSRSEDSSKASMALPRLMVADFPTALNYEPTEWFLSPTLSMIEQLVF